MKTYIFKDQKIFNLLYEKFFAMRVFHRLDDQGRLLIRFATKKLEQQLTEVELIKTNLSEINNE